MRFTIKLRTSTIQWHFIKLKTNDWFDSLRQSNWIQMICDKSRETFSNRVIVELSEWFHLFKGFSVSWWFVSRQSIEIVVKIQLKSRTSFKKVSSMTNFKGKLKVSLLNRFWYASTSKFICKSLSFDHRRRCRLWHYVLPYLNVQKTPLDVFLFAIKTVHYVELRNEQSFYWLEKSF